MRAAFLSQLTIGLVSFRIKAYTVVSEKEVSLKLLHGPCLAPIEERKFCSSCGQLVTDPVRGTEIPHEGGSKWILLTRKELESIIPDEAKGPKNIEIQQVVAPSEINTLWFGPSYYLVPENVSDSRSYSVISRAFREEKVVGIATLAYYKKIRLCMVYPGDATLILRQIYYARSLRNLEDYGIEVKQGVLTRKEVDLGRQLLRSSRLRRKFVHEEYIDPIPGRVAALVQAKNKGEPVEVHAPAFEVSPKVIDLTEALKESIKKLGRRHVGRPIKAAKETKPLGATHKVRAR